MKDRSDTGGVVIALGLILILLLTVLGVGAYFAVSRQQMAMAEAERARLSAEEAILLAEQARAEAHAAATSHAQSHTNDLPADQHDSIRAAVESILRAQEEAWNEGDIDAFMEHYWKSDDLTFSSGGKTTRGWEATLKRYRERYPTREQMGRLSLDELEITPLRDSAVLVLGQWSLERESEPVSGNFSLVVRRFDDRWLIIHDHTSPLSE